MSMTLQRRIWNLRSVAFKSSGALRNHLRAGVSNFKEVRMELQSKQSRTDLRRRFDFQARRSIRMCGKKTGRSSCSPTQSSYVVRCRAAWPCVPKSASHNLPTCDCQVLHTPTHITAYIHALQPITCFEHVHASYMTTLR